MRKVILGNRVYFILEEKDRDDLEDLFPWWPEVVVQDESGRFRMVIDDVTIKAVKDEYLKAGSRKSTGKPEWQIQFGRWIDREEKAGRVPLAPTGDGGKCWLITRTKKSVYDEIGPEIDYTTFERWTQPKNFKHRKFPVKWTNPGGRKKR